MSEHEYLIAMSVMVKEIDSLRYQVDYLTEENRKLRESQHIEVNINAKP